MWRWWTSWRLGGVGFRLMILASWSGWPVFGLVDRREILVAQTGGYSWNGELESWVCLDCQEPVGDPQEHTEAVHS